MHVTSIVLALALATSPLVAGLPAAPAELERRYYGGNANLAAMIARVFPSLSARHPIEAQVATKKANTRNLEDATALQARDIAADEDQKDLEDEEDANLEARDLAADEALEDLEDEETGALEAREAPHTGFQDSVKETRADTLESLYVSGGGV